MFSHASQEAVFWRGVFIHRYAGAEYALAELLLRLGARDEYRDLGQLPFSWPQKLKRFSVMLEAPGPLAAYATRARRLLIPITTGERYRHVLVHGIMRLNPNGDQPRLLSLKSHAFIDGEVGEITVDMTIDDLINTTQELGAWVLAWTRFVDRVFLELGLAPVAVADRVELSVTGRHI